ncbi:glycosyltransferase [Luminiphilus sp.]|nr:glycosyltransferase [Luminiphilus sp.]
MKILMAIPTFYPAIEFGGPIFSSFYLAKELDKHVELEVLTTDQRLVSDQDTLITRQEMPFTVISLKAAGGLEWLTAFPKAISNADVVLLNSLFSVFSIFVFIWTKLFRKKIVIQPRGSLATYGLGKRPLLKKLFLMFYKLDLPNTVFVVTSLFERQEVIDVFGANATIEVIPNGVDCVEFEDISRADNGSLYRPSVAEANACFVGRLHEKKRLDLIIAAIANLQSREINIVLHLVGGDDGFEQKAKALCKKYLRADTFRFYGQLQRCHLLATLRSMDCLVLVSENENFGNVVLEALGVNVPVVSSDNLPWQELEEAGLGVTCGVSVFDIAAAIELAASIDLKSSNSGFKFVESKFSWTNISTRFLNLL